MRPIFAMGLARQRRQLDERSLKPSARTAAGAAAKARQWTSRRDGMHGERPCTLEPEQSAALRERLLTAVGNITIG